jgi:hypothetical protein
MLLRTYLILGALMLGGYGATALSGKEFGSTTVRKVQPPIGRTGSRGYYFGGGGYRGGK